MEHHPILGSLTAGAAIVTPLWVNWFGDMGHILQVLGGIYLLMQIYYLYKNKGKK